MHELNISSPLRLARFFSTQQLFHKNPKLKNKILVYIFLYQTPVMPETFFYLEKENLGYVRTHTPFFALWTDFGICVAQKQGTCEDQDLIIIEIYYHLHLSMTGKMLSYMGRIQAKLGLGCWQL